jgi:hypothetical protein
LRVAASETPNRKESAMTFFRRQSLHANAAHSGFFARASGLAAATATSMPEAVAAAIAALAVLGLSRL